MHSTRVFIFLFDLYPGTCWSLFQRAGQSWERAVLSTNHKDRVPIWETEGDEGGHQGTYIWNTILNCSKTTFLEWKGQHYFIQGLLKCSYLDFSVKFMFFPFSVLVVRLILCICFLHNDVDKFRKRFVHLEENGGKSGPVNPLERKHVSLPRYLPTSTVSIIYLFSFLTILIVFLSRENLEIRIIRYMSVWPISNQSLPYVRSYVTVHLHMQVHVPVDTHLSKHIANR